MGTSGTTLQNLALRKLIFRTACKHEMQINHLALGMWLRFASPKNRATHRLRLVQPCLLLFLFYSTSLNSSWFFTCVHRFPLSDATVLLTDGFFWKNFGEDQTSTERQSFILCKTVKLPPDWDLKEAGPAQTAIKYRKMVQQPRENANKWPAEAATQTSHMQNIMAEQAAQERPLYLFLLLWSLLWHEVTYQDWNYRGCLLSSMFFLHPGLKTQEP